MATQVFADEELERLRGFPEIGRDELARFFTLTPADVAFVDPGRGRGPADRLGLAVALCTLPWLGFVPDKVLSAPPVAVARLAEQLGVDPAGLRSYGRRAMTRTEHLRLVAKYPGWRLPTTLELKELDEFLLARAMEHDSPTPCRRSSTCARTCPSGPSSIPAPASRSATCSWTTASCCRSTTCSTPPSNRPAWRSAWLSRAARRTAPASGATISAHRFRHTVGTQLAERGAKLHTIMKVLGHSSVSMALIYAQISDQEVLRDYKSVLGPGAVIGGPAALDLKSGVLPDEAVHWLKTNFFKTELELGHCLRLPAEGPCECDLYLTCAKFVTTPEYAPRLRARLEVEQQLIQDADERGWTREVERHQAVVRRLEALLAELGQSPILTIPPPADTGDQRGCRGRMRDSAHESPTSRRPT
ncbi:DUF4158 domain-containing protein [Nonomuraea sp. 3N208]|uniref:DUF4158 domain-containing protein n=1 Tax=Nonomuraea sp. 3N208 TaxID=3457421 RepID=UPI003FD50BBB